jgi:hypothetical protein
MFESDETKRLATLEKHGIDLRRATGVFAGPHVVLEARSDAEQPEIAVGYLDGVAIAVIFTHRGDRIRIVTARRARRNSRWTGRRCGS